MMGKPKIRFKGYNEDWEQRKLGEIAPLRGGYAFQSNNFLEEGIPIVKISNILSTGEVAGEFSFYEELDNDTNFILPDKAAVLAMSGATTGKVSILSNPSNIKFYQNQRVGYFKKTDGINYPFISTLVRSQVFNNQLNSILVTGAQPNVSSKDIDDFDVLIPTSYKEQKKIGAYFSNLDHLITLHQHKCDEMKKLKKYMLQKMFPKNGKKVPEIRFDGFTNDWEQRKFSELVMIERGGSPRPIDKYITKAENGLNWVKIGDAPEQSNYITKTSEKIIPEGLSKTREVHPGDLILSNSMSFGRPYIMAIDGCIHDGWLAIRDTEKRFDLKFLCTLLGTDSMLNQYKAMAAGSTVNNLNKELVGSTIVSFPKMDEQTKIGEYFTNLDHLNTLHQHKCDELQNFKKYMLQNMFV